MVQRPQRTTRYSKSSRADSENSLEFIDTGDNFLNRTPMAQALRSTIHKWDLMKLKSFCKAKTSSVGQIGFQQSGKSSSLTLHPTGG